MCKENVVAESLKFQLGNTYSRDVAEMYLQIWKSEKGKRKEFKNSENGKL